MNAGEALMMELVTIASQCDSTSQEETGNMFKRSILAAGGAVGFEAIVEMAAMIWGLLEHSANAIDADPHEYLRAYALEMAGGM